MPLLEIQTDRAIMGPTPVRIPLSREQLPAGFQTSHSLHLTPCEGEATIPAQWDGEFLVYLANDLAAGTSTRYRLSTLEANRELHVSLAERDGSLDLMLRQGLFCTYRFGQDVIRPYIWPLLGPKQKRVTRDFPMEEHDGESIDHPHHRSLWTAYDEVNHSGNWLEEGESGFIRHRGFLSGDEGPVFGGFAARNTWTNNRGAPVLEEVRSLRLYNTGDDIRLLDYEIAWTAAYGNAAFGDTKEAGIIAVRVACELEGDRGGLISNAEGNTGEAACWGQRAAWCDYSGVLNGEALGITVMDHPQNAPYPARWMVRDYGLMAVNPFSTACFGAGAELPFRLPEGESCTFAYRVLIHPGNCESGNVQRFYRDFADPPIGKILSK